MRRKILVNLARNLINVQIHRHYVLKGCIKCGVPLNGLLHDLTKFTPSELGCYKYYKAGVSPKIVERELKGYCMSELKHKSRNKHHWAYWVTLDKDMLIKTIMPEKYVVEMLCDWMAAANQKAGNVTLSVNTVREWYKLNQSGIYVHSITKRVLDNVIYASSTVDEYYERCSITSVRNMYYLYKNLDYISEEKSIIFVS